MNHIKSVLIFLLFFVFFASNSQTIDSINYSKRKTILWTTTSTMYVGTLVALNQLWYQDYDRSSFKTIDDSKQWKGMDKAGHTFSSYISGKYGIQAFKWAGYSSKQSALIGGMIGFTFLTTIEIFDGFSKEWGFSSTDIAANALGTSIAIGQELLFQEQILLLKFSYSPSNYREYRPDLLGENNVQAIIKDYNAQTYWASLNLNSISNSIKPKWLNLAFGYGANGMVNARGDYITESGERISPYSQYFISLDFDLERIPTKKKWLRTTLACLNFIKIPLPTIEFREGGFSKIHLAYF